MRTEHVKVIVNARELLMIESAAIVKRSEYTIRQWEDDRMLYEVNMSAYLYLHLLTVNGSFFEERCIFDVNYKKTMK